LGTRPLSPVIHTPVKPHRRSMILLFLLMLLW